MPQKLSKAERALDAEMLSLLEHAQKFPGTWFTIYDEQRPAIELLVKRGIFETRQPQNQYRLKPVK
jgi:hypothetical protein